MTSILRNYYRIFAADTSTVYTPNLTILAVSETDVNIKYVYLSLHLSPPSKLSFP